MADGVDIRCSSSSKNSDVRLALSLMARGGSRLSSLEGGGGAGSKGSVRADISK